MYFNMSILCLGLENGISKIVVVLELQCSVVWNIFWSYGSRQLQDSYRQINIDNMNRPTVLLDPNRKGQCDSDCNSALFLGKTYFAHEYKILQVFISTV